MIDSTDEMGAALLRALPADASWGWKPEDAKAWLADVLAVVERDLPRCQVGYFPDRCLLHLGHTGDHDIRPRERLS